MHGPGGALIGVGCGTLSGKEGGFPVEESNRSLRGVRFGVFEVDLRSGELRKQGLKIKLQGQPIQILALLLERPGELVTREELREKLWPADTFVDFEHGLNAAIKKLRGALGDSADSPRFVETLHRRGYRFIYPVEGVSRVSPAAGAAGLDGRSIGRRAWLAALGLVALLAVLIGLNVGGLRERLLGGVGPVPIESLAVLPLKNLMGDPEQEYFVEGMHEALTAELSKISALKVISRTSAMRYKETDKAMPQIARELGVAGLIEGSVLREGDQVRITVQLIHGPSDKYLWAGSFDRELRGILALHSEVARAIAGEIRIAVTPAEQARLARTPSVNPEAYQLYLQGRYYWNKRNPEGFEKAIQLFNQAIQKDPNNALAYSGLADSYVLLDFWISVQEALPQALAAAGTAVALDGSSAEARTSLGFALMRYQWDWAGAEREFRRAIELNPGYATAHHWYAVLLTSLGRHQEAYREIMRARDLDPVSPIIAHHVGLHFYCLGDYDQSLDWNRRTLEIDPRFPIAFVNLGRSYLQKGMYEQAIAEMQRAMEVCGDCPSLLGQLGHAYAAAGRRGEARRILERLKKQSRPLYLSYPIAEIYLGLGDEDQALTRLEQAHKERSAWMIYIRVEPKWDPLRRDPRFQDLLRRMNFPEN